MQIWIFQPLKVSVQVNLCQKHLFLDQLTHNMTKDCSLIYQFSTWKLQAQNMGRTCCVHKLFWMSKQKQKTICVHNMFSPCSELVVFMYWTGKSMNNLLSYCGLVDVRINVSDKDLPVQDNEILNVTRWRKLGSVQTPRFRSDPGSEYGIWIHARSFFQSGVQH